VKTETLTITNRSGSAVTVHFDEANTIEDAQNIVLRKPTVIKSPSKGETSTNVLIIAYKDTYPTRDLFLQQVESVGKRQVSAWIESNDDLIVMPPPDPINKWVLNIEENEGS
jgi:hypothetical protein